MSWSQDPRELLRATEGFDLATFDRAGTPGFSGDKKAGQKLMAERGEMMAELQERLFAEGRAGGNRSLLVVLQGIDTAGKGGIARHVMGMVDPQGVQIRSFGVPTEEEASMHFLWRIRKALPSVGRIGMFDRSHYEDVLVQRVENIVPEEVWRRRYDVINKFEAEITEAGVTVLKFALMITHDEQGERLMSRLDRPDKRWKFSKNDLKTRAKWDAYQEAYADVFRLTSTDVAPWYVLPANNKWYSQLAATEIITRTLIDMDPTWPVPDWDVKELREALAESMSLEALARSVEDTEDNVMGAIEDCVDFREDTQALHDDEERARKAQAQQEAWEKEFQETLAHKNTLLHKKQG